MTSSSFHPHSHPIWHPCSQMKDYETFPPIEIKRAEGSLLYTRKGEKLIDAISSWWCKPLGHGHPRLREALYRQSQLFEHVILANTTYEPLEALSEALIGLSPHFSKVFYSGDGSSAIEIALKMSLQYHAQTLGPGKRTQFAYLTHAYHGENLLSLSVSDLELYKHPFQSLCPKNIRLPAHTTISGTNDPNWEKVGAEWEVIEATLNTHASTLAGIIVEPLIQGAGGMKMYSPVLLKKMRLWSKKHHVHLIADEVMTGLGRTGTALATDHSNIEVDITILMKGLSAGFLPFSAVLTNADIYKAFYDDWETQKAFIHSNTYSGNALGAAVALEALKIYKEENWFEYVKKHSSKLQAVLTEVAERTGALTNIRHLGWVAAADLEFPNAKNSIPPRPAYAVYQECMRRGAFIRPLGETFYLLPAFNIPLNLLNSLADILSESILHVAQKNHIS